MGTNRNHPFGVMQRGQARQNLSLDPVPAT